MFTFNDKLYFWVLKPVAQGYKAVVPETARVSVSNFFHNLGMPIRFVSSLLQGKIKSAGIEIARFGINTLAGTGGLFDPAKEYNLLRQDEDLGQALGKYGMGNVFYIVWPFLGPSSVRDSIGTFGDGFLNPVNYVSPVEASLGIHTYDRVNRTSLHIGEYEDLKESSIDIYIAVRDAYIQNRNYKVKE
jgi:phospholipid-binding lipoprotein MlaA